MSDLLGRPAKTGRGKLDKAALAAHVLDFPDTLLRDRVALFRGDNQCDLGCLEDIVDHQKTTNYPAPFAHLNFGARLEERRIVR